MKYTTCPNGRLTRSLSTDAAFGLSIGATVLGETVYAMSGQEGSIRGADWRTDYLSWLIEREVELELVEAVSSRRFRFRYRPHRLFDRCEREIDNLNKEISERLRASGRTCVSDIQLCGRRVLQVSLTDHGNQAMDLRSLISDVLHLARRIQGRSAGASLG